MAPGIDEARRTLGLGGDPIRPSDITELRGKRAALAARVGAASNRKRRSHRQKELDAFDAALAVAMAHVVPEEKPKRRLASTTLGLIWLFTIAASAYGWRLHHENQKQDLLRDTRVRELESLGWQHIDNRRWREADATFAGITQIIPNSALANAGHAAAAAGRQEEETQFIGYWTGQALAELEAGRLDEAETAIRRVVEIKPAQAEAADISKQISETRIQQKIQTGIAAVRSLIDQRDWPTAAQRANELLKTHPDHTEVAHITREAHAGWERLKNDLARATSLFDQARGRDKGEFDPQALEWLREAAMLAPDNADIAALLEKMSSYTRTIRVPGDFPTPHEALAQSRDNDRIVIGKGTWEGPLVTRHSVELQGAGPTETIITCPAADGNAITLRAAKSRVSGITFRHESLHVEPGDRFSAATVTSGECEFINCHFTFANGHGLAVLGGAKATVNRCRFADNAWNGIAVIGKGTTVQIGESESADNFHNGIESWDGASATLKHNRITGNTRNGIHSDQGGTTIICENNIITGNREFGICLTSAGGGHLTGNQIRGNLLGGILVRKSASGVVMRNNESTSNTGPDLVLETGLTADSYASNTLTPNRRDALHTEAKIDP